MADPELHVPAFVNYECQLCGFCCRQYDITFSEEEHKKLSKYNWGKLEPVLEGKEWCAPLRRQRSPDAYRLRYTSEGGCIFLSPDNKCLMHRHVGELGKTLGCCVYPFTFADTPTGVYVGCRFSCLAVANALGEPLVRATDALRQKLSLVRESGLLPRYADEVVFAGKRTVPWRDYLRLEEALIRILLRDDLSLARRLFMVHKLIEILRKAKLENVRGPKFKELVQILAGGLLSEATKQELPCDPGALQRILFRQFCFIFQRRQGGAYQEMNLAGRLKTRAQNLKRSILFSFGFGTPRLPDFPAPFPIAEVARVRFRPTGPDDELALSRFLAAKIFGKQYFGRLFFGYPLLPGLVFLLLSAGAVMWYARAYALAQGRNTTEHEDIIEAIRYVDYCYGSSPVPALAIERLRTRILGHEDTAARVALAQFE